MKRFIFVFCLIFCAITLSAEENVLKLTCQPYKLISIFIDGVEAQKKLLSSDKTLGVFEIKIPYDASVLLLEAPGYKPKALYLHHFFSNLDATLSRVFHNLYINNELFPSEEHGNYGAVLSERITSKFLFDKLKRKSEVVEAFVALDKETSICNFVKSIDCSLQPKSLEFIDENTIIVPLLDDEGFEVIDIYSGEARLVSPPAEYAKQKGFVESLYIPSRSEVWVSQMTTAAAHVFSSEDFSYKATVKSKGQWSKVLAYNPVYDKVYLSNWTSLNISVIDPNTYTEESLIPLANVPRGIAVSEDGKHLFFAEFESPSGASSGHIVKFSVDNLTREKSFGAAGAKRHCVTDFARQLLYVSDMSRNRIEVYSLVDESLVATIPVYHNPNTIALANNGEFLIVSCRGPNNPDKGYLYKGYHFGQVHIIDTKTFKTVDIIEGGNQPTGLAVSRDGKTFAFSDFLDARIRVYRIN